MEIHRVDGDFALDDDLVLVGDNQLALDRLPAAKFDLIYMDPPFNTGPRPGAPDGRRGARSELDADRVRRSAVPHAAAAVAELRGRVRRLPGVPGAAAGTRARAARPARDALLPHRLPRGALLQAAARRAVRPRRVPQRADLGLRLRRQAAAAVAGQARHDPRLRAHPGRRTTSTPTRSSASRTWLRGWSAPRRPPAASGRPTSGFTRSSRPTAARRPATRPRSPRASCAGWWRRRRGRAVGALTRSPGRGRSAPCAASSGGGSCWSTSTRSRSTSCARGWAVRRTRARAPAREPARGRLGQRSSRSRTSGTNLTGSRRSRRTPSTVRRTRTRCWRRRPTGATSRPPVGQLGHECRRHLDVPRPPRR